MLRRPHVPGFRWVAAGLVTVSVAATLVGAAAGVRPVDGYAGHSAIESARRLAVDANPARVARGR